MNGVEIIGYTGSVLVAVSLMMKNIWWLRRINLVGGATFALYGLLLKAYPVFALNGFIALVDIYYLFEMKRKKEYFSLVPINSEHNNLFSRFIDFYKTDIKKFFPDFKKDKLYKGHTYFILRNLVPVGLINFEELSDTDVKIGLDYAIPDYRDLKNARFAFFAEDGLFKKRGIKKLIVESSVNAHQKYLKKLGFVKQTENQNLFYKNLDK